jgi:hypothetical protein
MKNIFLSQLTFANFTPLLNSRFRVSVDAANLVEVELIEATRGNSMSNAQHEFFSLLFNGPANPVLSQRIYPFEHDELGRFDLFIVPVGKNQNGNQYQVIFNRTIKPG